MTFRKLHIVLIIAVVIILGINFYFMSQVKNEKETIYIPGKQTDAIKIEEPVTNKPNLIEISTKCKTDFDCSWQITNCCPENAGGHWQCISQESKIECNELLLCPQVISPKPEQSCSCIQGSCVPR